MPALAREHKHVHPAGGGRCRSLTIRCSRDDPKSDPARARFHLQLCAVALFVRPGRHDNAAHLRGVADAILPCRRRSRSSSAVISASPRRPGALDHRDRRHAMVLRPASSDRRRRMAYQRLAGSGARACRIFRPLAVRDLAQPPRGAAAAIGRIDRSRWPSKGICVSIDLWIGLCGNVRIHRHSIGGPFARWLANRNSFDRRACPCSGSLRPDCPRSALAKRPVGRVSDRAFLDRASYAVVAGRCGGRRLSGPPCERVYSIESWVSANARRAGSHTNAAARLNFPPIIDITR